MTLGKLSAGTEREPSLYTANVKDSDTHKETMKTGPGIQGMYQRTTTSTLRRTITILFRTLWYVVARAIAISDDFEETLSLVYTQRPQFMKTG